MFSPLLMSTQGETFWGYILSGLSILFTWFLANNCSEREDAMNKDPPDNNLSEEFLSERDTS